MKVRELIAELQQYKNQEAEVTILANCINPDMEEYDEELTYIECWGTDSDNDGSYITILATIQPDQVDKKKSNIFNFDDWVNYMLNNSDYKENELMEFKDHYQNLINFDQNTEKFIEFNEFFK